MDQAGTCILDGGCVAALEFEVERTSAVAVHRDLYYGRRVNIWRDIFPPGLEEALMGKSPGEAVPFVYEPGEALPAFDQSLSMELSRSSFIRRNIGGRPIVPRVGRFYPRGLLAHVPNVWPQDMRPFRLVEIGEKHIIADLNHPAALFALKGEVRLVDAEQKSSDTGGRTTQWMEAIFDYGPGMEVPLRSAPTDFESADAFKRADESDDAGFYKTPRMVGHIDSLCSAFIREECRRHLRQGMRVLDLMSSMQSHLPEDMGLHVVGLGMNMEELKANPLLAEHMVHDLNKSAKLPFERDSFDAVVLHLSVEYLTDPKAVIAEVADLLKPGGPFLLSFSNRWFPPKAIQLWTELHEFERMGFVLGLLMESGAFEKLSTFSARNYWRPETDAHYPTIMDADPAYVVGGVKK
jgi:SAM-dependent methyltransferase/FKBP-type peptidyl-prolyl cis-trans isomerase 2